MPRPPKKRFVCCAPTNRGFTPEAVSSSEPVLLTVDEYEAIRLIDLVGSTQEECARRMNISRTTVQGIYNSARTKLADALVNGRQLQIKGGDYVTCPRYSGQCGHGKRCCRHISAAKEAEKDAERD